MSASGGPSGAGRRRTLIGLGGLGAGLALTACGTARPKPAEYPAVSGTSVLDSGWRFKIGDTGFGFQPAVVGDAVYAAAGKGWVARLDAATGRSQWEVRLPKGLLAGVGADADRVIVATLDGNVQALDVAGKELWRSPIGSEAVSLPAIGEGLVVVRTSSNRIFAFDAGSGERRWVYQRNNPPLVLRQNAVLTIDGGSVFAGVPGGRLLALAVQSGAVRWETAVSQPRGSNEIERIADVVGETPVDGNTVCAATYQGRLVCFDAASGRPLWVRDIPSATGPAMDRRMLVVVDSDDQIHALSPSGGSVWRNDQYKLRRLTSPLLTQDAVIVADGFGMVHALSRDDGRTIGRARTDGSAILATPGRAEDGTIIVQTTSGSLYGLKLS